MVSEYANGQYGWVLSLMFAAYGLSSLALAFAIRSQATTRRDRLGLILLAESVRRQPRGSISTRRLSTIWRECWGYCVCRLPR